MRKRRLAPQIAHSFFVALLLVSTGQGATYHDSVAAGERAFNEGRYADAIKLLQNVPADARSCDLLFMTGLARYRLQRFSEALVDLQSAVGCNPKNVSYRLALAEAYMQKRDDNKALLALQASLEAEPDNKTALAEVGAIYLRHEMNAEAIVPLKRLVTVDPRNADAYSDLGAAYAGIFDFKNAQLNFAQALQIEPKNASALIGLGHAELKSEHPALAAQLFTKAVNAVPRAYEPHYLRALALSETGQNAEAAADLEAAIRLGGKDPEIYYHLAQIDRALGKQDDARKALAQFSSLKSLSNESDQSKREAAKLTLEAKAMVEQGNLTTAVADLQKVLSLEGETPRTLFRLASLYFDTQQYDTAAQNDRKAIDLDPSEWSYWYLLGLIERKRGNDKPAEHSFETALHLSPNSAEVENQLGELSQARGDYREAIRRFEAAIRLDPGEAAYQNNLRMARSLSQR